MKSILKGISILVLSSCMAFAQNLTLKSDDLKGQLTSKHEYNGFGCKGENISPHLSWKGAPKGTKSFAVTVFDADAPTGSGWWHWLVFNIDSKTTTLVQNAGNINNTLLPKNAIQSKTDFGSAAFGGSCPPKVGKIHQYTFTVFALDVEDLGLTKDANPALVGFMINQHTIQKASIVSYNTKKTEK